MTREKVEVVGRKTEKKEREREHQKVISRIWRSSFDVKRFRVKQGKEIGGRMDDEGGREKLCTDDYLGVNGSGDRTGSVQAEG